MKKTILILSAIILTGTGFYGCKKGEGDPMLSTHTRKGRLTGDWTLTKGTSTDVSGSSTTMTNITETSATVTAGTTTFVYAPFSSTISIVKDGTWSSKETGTTTGFSYTLTESGTWNWTAGVGDVKKKSQITLTTLSSTDVQTFGTTTTTTVESYTGSEAPTAIWDIFQLKNKEMITKGQGTALVGTTSSSSTSEYTFTKEK